MTHPVVSVIVPVSNDAMVIGDQLEGLAAQTYVGPLEVVVADQGSSDGTPAVASLYHHRFPSFIVVVGSARPGAGSAGNVGALAARGDVLAFCDADNVVEASWLSAMIGALIDADVVIGGMDGEGVLAHAEGMTLAIRTEMFHRLGGFRRSGPSERVGMVWRARRAGCRVAFAPDARTHHVSSGRPRAVRGCDRSWRA